MDIQRVAEIQVVLEGIRLPATREELIAYARRYDALAAEQLARLPARSYDSIDSAAEELVRVQPAPVKTTWPPAAPSAGSPYSAGRAPTGSPP